MKEHHFFDLDGTLWELNQQAWIIDKDKPEIPLLKISQSELLILKQNYG